MTLALVAATRATCQRGKVGVVFVKNKRVLATGYNGAVPGQPHCLEVGCLQDEPQGPCKRAAHAEQNAIAYAARYGVSLDGSTMYCSNYTPCLTCCYSLIQAGCLKIVYRTLYHDERSLAVLAAAAVHLEQYAGPLISQEALAGESEGGGRDRVVGSA